MRRLLLLSNSTLHGSGYLEYAAEAISKFLKDADVTEVLFFPFALHDQDGYASKAKSAFSNWGFELESIHTKDDPLVAVKEAQAFFVGGGNTFRLLNTLYKLNLVEAVRERVLTHGVPYIGSSAGTNVATISICTTNDMPIVYPPSFKAFGLVPFNINPHYIDAHPEKHMGETREERIAQYHEQPGTPPVLGLREGSYLEVSGDTINLRGPFPARLFRRDEPAKELDPDSDLSFLSKC